MYKVHFRSPGRSSGHTGQVHIWKSLGQGHGQMTKKHDMLSCSPYINHILLVIILPALQGWPGWVNLGGWLNTKMVSMQLEPVIGHSSQY